MQVAEVRLWGRTIGAVSQPGGVGYATFQYAPDFAESNIQVAPLTMPLARDPFAFPQIQRAFHGLPGLLADSLPDKFGNALIDAWLATMGRSPGEFTSLDRLCYIGTRGMGALEFAPSTGPRPTTGQSIEVEDLVALASKVLTARENLRAVITTGEEEQALTTLLRVGTSAGGARAKALIAWNPDTQEVRSGQVGAGSGFEQWILKFDGVSANRDKELSDPLGYGAIEYAYAQMAKAAGIQMTECRLFEEGGRRHFMTLRFDRTEEGRKLHMLSLGGMGHLDFNAAGAHGYEQAFLTMRRLGLSMDATEEQFRRMVFNVVARNQDDHVKNIAYLMDQNGRWSLSPAYDVTWAFNPDGEWTSQHQMTVNGKRDGFRWEDLDAVAQGASMKRGRAEAIHEEVWNAVSDWRDLAQEAGVDEEWAAQIGRTHRMGLAAGSRP